MPLGRVKRRVAAAALGLDLLAAGFGGAAAQVPCPPPAAAPRRYAGRVTQYVADLKPSFPEHELYSPSTALTRANYRAVLDGLARNAAVSGVRLPIVPAYGGRADYPPLYANIYDYARSIGLVIYASPLSVGTKAFSGWSDDRYASWLAAYAGDFRPDILSPFNEAGIDDHRIATIVEALRAKLTVPVRLMGPDRQHVERSVMSLSRAPGMVDLFDVVGSHNADRDASATAENWTRLVAVAGGRPVWSSENPANWTRGQIEGLPGMDQAVSGGVDGIVVWMAKPSLVDGTGRPTAKACEIATHLLE